MPPVTVNAPEVALVAGVVSLIETIPLNVAVELTFNVDLNIVVWFTVNVEFTVKSLPK